MFNEREIRTTPTMVIGAGLWAASIGIWAVNCILDERSLATLAIIVCAAAATATVRGFFQRWAEEVKNAIVIVHAAQSDQVKPLH